MSYIILSYFVFYIVYTLVLRFATDSLYGVGGRSRYFEILHIIPMKFNLLSTPNRHIQDSTVSVCSVLYYSRDGERTRPEDSIWFIS